MADSLKLLPLMICISVLLLSPPNAESQSPTPSPSPLSTPATSTAPEPSSSAPAPALDCTSDLMNLSSCLTYVEKGSNLTVPDKGCCPSLSSLVANNPICLCQLLSSGGNPLGLEIDTTKALTLPTACKVDTPDVSLCAAIGIPVASPMGVSPTGPVGVSPAAGSPGSSSGTITGMPSAAPPAPNSVDSITKASMGMATLITALLFIMLY